MAILKCDHIQHHMRPWEKLSGLSRACINHPTSQMKTIPWILPLLDPGKTGLGELCKERGSKWGWACERASRGMWTLRGLYSLKAHSPWAGLDTVFNLPWSASFLVPLSCSLWLLITAGTCSEYQGRFCWAWQGPSSPDYNLWHGGWIHGHILVGASVPMRKGIPWEQSRDTSACKKGRVHHKQDITTLQRLTRKAFTAGRKLHRFLTQQHFSGAQMPINPPAGELCSQEHGGASGCRSSLLFGSHKLHPWGLQEALSLAERDCRLITFR